MRNLGNTCYLNATIQCLLAVKRIRYILDVITPKSNAVKFLIECFDKKQSCTQTPLSVYELYVSLFCNIERNSPQDSVECLLRFLDYFERQTEIRKTYNYITCINHDQCSCVSFWEKIPTNSIVRDIFTGITKTKSIHKIPSVLVFEIIGSTKNLHIEETIVIDHAHGFERTRLVYRLQSLILYSNAHYTCIVYNSDHQCYLYVDDTRIEQCTIDMINKDIMIRCAIYEQL